MPVVSFPLKAKSILGNIGQRLFKIPPGLHGSSLERTPARDCYGSVLIQQILVSIKYKQAIQLASDLLEIIKNKGYRSLNKSCIIKILEDAKTPDQAFLAVKLADITQKSTSQSFYGEEISEILKSANTSKKVKVKADLAEKFMEIVNDPELGKAYKSCGSEFRFYDLRRILLSTNTPEEAELILKYAKFRDKRGNAVFPVNGLLTNTQNLETARVKLDFALKLSEMLDSQGRPRFEGSKIRAILYCIGDKYTLFKIDFAERLLKMKNNDNSLRFSYFEIEHILSDTRSPEEMKLVEKFLEITNKNNDFIINVVDAANMAASVSTPEMAQLKFNLANNLAQIKDNGNNNILASCDIAQIVSSTYAKGTALLKFAFAQRLANMTDIHGHTIFESHDIRCIVNPIQKPMDIELSEILMRVQSQMGTPRLKPWEIGRIVASADTKEKNRLVAMKAVDKALLEKIDKLEPEFGEKLYFNLMRTDAKVDIDRMANLYDFLKKNKMSLQIYGENKVTDAKILDLFCLNMINACDLIDDATLKYATRLKYEKFDRFISRLNLLRDRLNKKTYLKLKEKLSQDIPVKLKFESLQHLIAIVEESSISYKEKTILELIDLIKSPQVTNSQIDLANEIFTSAKPYQEQIKEFFDRFNVPESQKSVLRRFFEQQKLDKSIIPAISTEEQILILNKRIKAVVGNSEIPQGRKASYIEQIQSQIDRIKKNPISIGSKKINDKALSLLIDQIENHINTPNIKIEMENLLLTPLFENIGIEPTAKLVDRLNFDKQYVSELMASFDSSNFTSQLKALIDLINKDTSKPLSVLIETLEHNQTTKLLFEKNGIDYQKWTKFNDNLSLPFSCETDLAESIRGVEFNIVNELDGDLFKAVDKKQTDKILQAIADAGYELGGGRITKDGQAIAQKDLEKIVNIFKNTINQNANFWDKTLPDSKAEMEKNELIDHLLKGRKKEVEDLEKMVNAKMDLRVRLTDDDDIGRNLFLGNHVECCTAIGKSNSFAAPQHLMNSFVRAMEIVDKYGNSYGNSMCYFAKIDDKLSFVIDSFEASGKLGGNQVVTDSIVAFAKKVTAEMGQPDIPIYFGPRYNKINMSKFELKGARTVKIIGSVEDDTYIDAIGGNQDINQVHKDRDFYQLES